MTVISAGLYVLAFPPASLAAAAWGALVPLWLAAVSTSPARAAACGALWGVLSAYGVGTWFPDMVSSYFGWPWWAGWIGFVATALMSASIYYGTFTAWLSWCAARRAACPLSIAAGWVVCEWLRAHTLLGNPWGLLGYSQPRLLPLLQIADVGGVFAVSLVVAGVNAAILMAVLPAARRHAGRGGLLSVIALPVIAGLYGAWSLGQRFTGAPAVPVGVVQSGLARAFAWQPGTEAFGLSQHIELTRATAGAGARLVVWPESSIAFYLQEDGPEREALTRAVRDLRVDLALGGAHYEFEDRQTRYHNSVFFLHDGEVVGRYDKRLLVPFAEHGLLDTWFERPTPVTPGDRATVVELASLRLGPVVCSESMQADLVGSMVTAGAEVIVNLSNDSWLGVESAARHQLDMAILRAVEARRYVVRAASTGISAIIDPYGRVLQSTPFGQAATIRGDVAAGRHVSVYHRWGDVVVVLAALVVAWTTIAAYRHEGVITRDDAD